MLVALLYLPAAEYLNNKNLSGARKRAAEEESEEADSSFGSGSSSSVTLGSEDTNEGMSSSKKSTTTPAKAPAPAPPASSSKTRSKQADPEYISHLMDQMKLSGVVERGYNFDCSHPYFWWTFKNGGFNFLRIDLLCWTSPPAQCTPKISPDGKTFYFDQQVPGRFLEAMRQFIYYDGEIDGDERTCDASIITENVNAINQINEAFDLHPIKPLVTVKLPFGVQQEFEDPYRPNEPGYQLTSFPHELSTSAQGVFYVFSACMKEAKVARKKASVPMQSKGWAMPPPRAPPGRGAAADDEDIDDDEDHGMG